MMTSLRALLVSCWKLILPQTMHATAACYSWLLRKDILKSSIPCPLCSRPMVRLQPDQSHPDRRLYLAKCNKRVGGRNGSLFVGGHAILQSLVHSTIAWSYRYPYQYDVRECGFSARKTDELDVLLNVLYIWWRGLEKGPAPPHKATGYP